MDDALHVNAELKDESTSCTSSSIATSASTNMTEEIEELHLGAEANSFSKDKAKFDSIQTPQTCDFQNTKLFDEKYLNKKLVVMKQGFCSVDNTEVDVTYSTVSNLSDLLRARECDPDEVLTNLGFADCNNEVVKRSVLSRFKPSPLLNTEDSQVVTATGNQTGSGFNPTQTHYKESIDKTQEWLAHRHSDGDFKYKSNSSKLNLSTTAPPLPPKKSIGNKSNKWKRFSKSRQSSFELLLPNVKEEESSHEVEPRSASIAAPTQHPPIRESSIEFLSSVDLPETKVLQETDKKIPVASGIPGEKKRNFLRDSFKHPDKNPPSKDDELKLSRAFRTSLLLASQRDSFELEEINSSNEEPTECCRRRRSGKNSLTLEYRKRATATYRGLSHSPNSEGGSDENESSSGFGEDDSAIPINQCEAELNDDSYQTVSPQTVVESVQSEPLQGIAGTIRSTSTRYVYNVKLGTSKDKPKILSTLGNCNDNNNAPGAITCHNSSSSLRCCVSSGALDTNYISLKPAASWVRIPSPSKQIYVTSLPSSTNNNESATFTHGKSPRIFSDARRRRKEFAERSALSGDSIVELFSSSLIRQKGEYFVTKQRPGRYSYFSSSVDSRTSNSLNSSFPPTCNNSSRLGDALTSATADPARSESAQPVHTLPSYQAEAVSDSSSLFNTFSKRSFSSGSLPFFTSNNGDIPLESAHRTETVNNCNNGDAET